MKNKKSPDEGISLIEYKKNNEVIKCNLCVSNWDEFIKYAEKMKEENKSIEEILKFNLKFYGEPI